MMETDVLILGAGAAGCFCAIEAARRHPHWRILVLEAGRRPLAKVAVTGGGRCNLTNSFEGIRDLSQAYPRGARVMKHLLSRFDQNDTCAWFEREGVELVLQPDHCYFPASQDAMQIVRTLLRAMEKAGVSVRTGQRALSAEKTADGFKVVTAREEFFCNKLIITTGGSPSASGLSFLEPLGLDLVPPVPSLFSFAMQGEAVRALTGTVVENASVSIPRQKWTASGPLLITDWGMSGPAILRLSSYAARFLAGQGYRTPLRVDWTGGKSREEIHRLLTDMTEKHPQKMVRSTAPSFLPARLWAHLCLRALLREDLRWAEMGRKGAGRLEEILCADTYQVSGKNRFREEFVTCGGVSLSGIDPNTLESKVCKNLYFAGEILDIDAITGGFNLQAAWSGGYVVAASLS